MSTIRANRPFDVVYTDVWGPAPIVSFDKFTYYVVFVDYYTKYSWLFLLKNKSDVTHVFLQFQKLVANFFNAKIRILYTDGGSEFTGLTPQLVACGIQHLKSPPYTPQLVGSAERKHRHIVETGLVLLHHSALPLKFWSAAFQTATYLINRLPT